MSDSNIKIFRGPARDYAFSLPLLAVVRRSLAHLLQVPLENAFIELNLLSIPSDIFLSGAPSLVNLDPQYGYTYVKVYVGGRHGQLIYKHPHPVEDIIGITLRSILQEREPDVTEWSYCLDVPALRQETTSRKTPDVQGAVPIGTEEYERPRFGIRRLQDDSLPGATVGDFKAVAEPGEYPGRVKVLISEELHQDLIRERYLSPEVEEGGFLVGRAFVDEESPGGWLVEVTAALNAEQTGASLLHFTFTGDSFTAVKQTLRHSRPGERLLGWFHTHLFPATDKMGLSSIDYTLHFRTFTIPWQLAGLINIDDDLRVLRFYMRQGKEMVRCPLYRIGGNKKAKSGLTTSSTVSGLPEGLSNSKLDGKSTAPKQEDAT